MNLPSQRRFAAYAAGSVTLLWLQFLLTARFAGIDGALHGPKRPLYVLALVLATAALLLPSRAAPGPDRRDLLPAAALVCGFILLAAGCYVWLPPASWRAIPYLDNWTARYLSTIDGIDLLERGAAIGWNWDFLGGYHTASDITQSLALVAWAPVALLGPALGFHLTHVLLFLTIPPIVYVDLQLDGDRRLAALAAGLAAVGTAGTSYILMRSGDTNSLAGLMATLLALLAGHAAAKGRRWGGPLLAIALTTAAWSHAGSFIYTLMLLGGEAVLSRDMRRLTRAIVGGISASIAALPLTWELWRYPGYFIANNVVLDPGAPIDWVAVARKLYYNVELLWLPGRWSNDFLGLTYVLLPLLVFAAWALRDRTRAYAVAALGVLAMSVCRPTRAPTSSFA